MAERRVCAAVLKRETVGELSTRFSIVSFWTPALGSEERYMYNMKLG